MRKLPLRSATALTILFTGLSSAAFAEPTEIDVLLAPIGAGPYLAVATMQNYASDYTDKISPKAVETPGFTYNVRYLASQPDMWENTLIGSGMVVEWGMHQKMMLDYSGISEELRSLDALGPSQGIDALLDGRADIGTLAAHSNFDFSYTLEAGPFKTLESSGRDYHYVSIDPELIQSYIDDTGAPFKIQNVKAGTFSGQTEDLTSFGNIALISAHKDFPEDLAYEFTKLWIESGPQIGEYSAIAKIWEPETISEIARSNPELIHPGAMRAYREFGLVTD